MECSGDVGISPSDLHRNLHFTIRIVIKNLSIRVQVKNKEEPGRLQALFGRT